MELKKIEHNLTVCKVQNVLDIDMTTDFYFIGKTDEELSLVCKTEDVPAETTERAHGVNLLMFPYLLIIPERFNLSLARTVDGGAEALGWRTIRQIIPKGAV